MLSRVEWTVDAPRWPTRRVHTIDVTWAFVGTDCAPGYLVRDAEQDARRCGTATLRHPDGRVFHCVVVAHA